MLLKYTHYFKSFAKQTKIFILGICFALFLTLLLVLSLPIYLYRWIIIKIGAPYFSGENIREPVCTFGQAFATELLNKSGDPRAPRCTLTITLVMDRPTTMKELYESIDKNWIQALEPSTTKLKYPELRQYISTWMGFMFWKQDENFELSNHLKLHVIDESGGDTDSEIFLNNLNEELLNQSYIANRSPWEVHLVQNYKNSGICPGNLSALLYRFHHGLVDGYSLVYLLVESFSDCNMEEANLVKPSFLNRSSSKSRLTPYDILNIAISFFTFPIKFIYELGHVASFVLKEKTLYHISDEQKTWKQFFVKAPLIPINKIKFIKQSFGVSFASVTDSACSAGLGKLLAKLMENKYAENPELVSPSSHLVFAGFVPRPNRPKKLTVYFFMAAYEAPIDPGMDSLERLRECWQRGRKLANSPMALVFEFLLQIFSGHLAVVAKFLMENRYFGTGVTSFPGPGVALEWNGKKCISGNFAAGAANGLAGVIFMVCSYAGSIQICSTAEKGVLTKMELEQLMKYVCDEIEILYDLAIKARSKEENEKNEK